MNKEQAYEVLDRLNAEHRFLTNAYGYGARAEDNNESRESEGPCYTYRWSVSDTMRTSKVIKEYVDAVRATTMGVIMMSVTERDSNHQQFRRVVKRLYPKAAIIPGRSTNHGGYRVWLICFTGTAKD